MSQTALRRALDSDVEPWHLPHFAMQAGDRLPPARRQPIDTDQMLATGAIEGPFRRCRPVTRWRRAARRFFRRLGRFLMAPRIEL